ncbi:hypothetical protein HGI30_14970 [Paenibacillus albicereus]|uniref:Uncharacterized protein n=1 Tax=Paenibacillus albicereus TaxID=2726185 RepID=A0A6H2GZ72_9BACL|nr:hypothetical protein [Paenibacillus albicereus]QJC52734.1 hypothetical protein HGI30_14970 [Paenibacillus albicereus]
MSRTNLNKISQALVVDGMRRMIEDDGMTFREMAETIEAIKRDTYPAMMQIAREAHGGS